MVKCCKVQLAHVTREMLNHLDIVPRWHAEQLHEVQKPTLAVKRLV